MSLSLKESLQAPVILGTFGKGTVLGWLEKICGIVLLHLHQTADLVRIDCPWVYGVEKISAAEQH